MPAASKQQQKIMGLALAYKKGEVPTNYKVSPAVKKLAKTMSTAELEKYASTKTSKLPKTIKKEHAIDILKKTVIQTQNGTWKINLPFSENVLFQTEYLTIEEAITAVIEKDYNNDIFDSANQTYAQLKSIITTESSGRLNGEVIDVASAKMVMTVVEALKTPELKKKFLKLSTNEIIYVTYKLMQ
jgi:hypothetical protein